MLDFKRANELLKDKGPEAICRQFSLRFKREGEWLLMSCPWRVDKNPSFVIHHQSGRWKDLANPEDRGDLLDLVAKLSGREPIEVVRDLVGDQK